MRRRGMIVRIRRGQQELRIKLTGPGGEELPRGREREVRLELREPGPRPGTGLSPIIREGCWPGFPTGDMIPRPHERPAIVYPAFEMTDEGDISFRFDALLWSRPPGRLIGKILVGDFVAGWLDIDHGDEKWLPASVDGGRRSDAP